MSNIKRDFIASNLRSQINNLAGILGNIENNSADCDYTQDSLKEVEVNIKQIRKLCAED
jgi:sensor histidine kinase regulating citrate/malate metabolism